MPVVGQMSEKASCSSSSRICSWEPLTAVTARPAASLKSRANSLAFLEVGLVASGM
jgi:hypothetical protein